MVVDHAPQGLEVAPDPRAGIIRQRDPGERPALEWRDEKEAHDLPGHAAYLRVRRRPLQHKAVDELRVNDGQFHQHLATERIANKGCALHADLMHPGSQRIGKLAHRERLRRLVAQAEAGQVRCVDLQVRGEMLCERDHVAARHPEPVDQDHGQAVIRHGVDRNSGMHGDAADAVASRCEAPMVYCAPLAHTPSGCRSDHGQTERSPGDHRSDPPPEYFHLPALPIATMVIRAIALTSRLP